MAEPEIRCPQCDYNSGDDWTQCGQSCPMIMSPYYNPNWRECVVQRKPIDETEYDIPF